MEEIATSIVKAFINSGPVGLLCLILMGMVAGLVKWLRSVYKTLGEIQERRVLERDAVVTALQSAADGLEDNAKLAPEIIDLLRVIRDMICPEPVPPRRRLR